MLKLLEIWLAAFDITGGTQKRLSEKRLREFEVKLDAARAKARRDFDNGKQRSKQCRKYSAR